MELHAVQLDTRQQSGLRFLALVFSLDCDSGSGSYVQP